MSYGDSKHRLRIEYAYHFMFYFSYLPLQNPMTWKTLTLPSRSSSDVTIEEEGKYFPHMLSASIWKDLYKHAFCAFLIFLLRRSGKTLRLVNLGGRTGQAYFHTLISSFWELVYSKGMFFLLSAMW